jgi:Ca2+-transporting ATPase
LCGLLFTGDEKLKKIIEAVSIIGVGIIIMFTTAVADYMKDNQFVRLQALVKDEEITVIRGKYNATHKVKVHTLVVGDVILLETGQRVPADCIVIDSVDLRVDEKPEDNDVQQKPKGPHQAGDDPFLRSESLVIKGTCKALVASVGSNCSRGSKATSLADQINENTALQKKLKNLSG